jgi:antitoxin component YwqK of YwqJK toxin-antitoxin module
MVGRKESMMEPNTKKIMLLKKYSLLITLSLILFGCKSEKETSKDDSFTFIERNSYLVDSYNGLDYYRLAETTKLMDGYYVVGDETKKWEEFECKKGVLNGDYIVFHENGEIFSFSKYANGKLNGEELRYDPLGNLTKKSMYKNGVLVDSQFTYFDTGKVESEIKYENGQKVETLYYNMLGHIVSQSYIKNSRTITQRLKDGKLYSEMVSSNYDDYETIKFFNEDGSTKAYLRKIEERDSLFIVELNDDGKEIKRVNVQSNPVEAAQYSKLFN